MNHDHITHPVKPRVYIDLEYCYPGMTASKGRPSAADLRQVVQIGAIKYDHLSGEELDSLNILTTPAYTKQLPKFFIELTGIEQQQVEELAVPFKVGLTRLVEFCQGLDMYTFDGDEDVLRQNCNYFHISYPFAPTALIRVRPMLRSWGLEPSEYSSGTLYRAANLDISGRVHDALHDVRSMAAGVREFERRLGS